MNKISVLVETDVHSIAEGIVENSDSNSLLDFLEDTFEMMSLDELLSLRDTMNLIIAEKEE